jgi:hypothetical protein
VLPTRSDTLIIGAGPAGTAATALLKKAGHDSVILRKKRFPRFCIGKSLIPHCCAVRGLILICGLLLGFGCAHDPLLTTVAWRVPYQLQPVPVSLFAESPSFTHEVTLKKGSDQFSFTGHGEWQQDTFTLVGLAPFGRLFSLVFDDDLSGTFNVSLPSFMKPRYIMGDLELIYWPAESLIRGGLAVEEDQNQRIISGKGKKVATIRYERGGKGLAQAATLINHSRRYSLHVLPVAVTPSDL